MDIALCYENVDPGRGGCETYIADLSHRLIRDGHTVHLYACRWTPHRLPSRMYYHRLECSASPRFLRPWRFGYAVEQAMSRHRHDVTLGFDKTWGQDVLYPQGGLHAASAFHNRFKFSDSVSRWVATAAKWLDPATWSFAKLERKQYLGERRPRIIVNSRMVREHFREFLGIGPESVDVIPSAIDPERFLAEDRLRRRNVERRCWQVRPDQTTALFVAMNYRLKGLTPLLYGMAALPHWCHMVLAVVGHPKTSAYERLARRLGIAHRVRFLGFRADPKDAYFAADLLVHPTFYDPCSLVVLEALACGLPVVTTRFNGASELLTPPEDGLVIDDPHDAPALASALAHFDDPKARKSAGRAAVRTAERWTFEHHYQELLRIFNDVSKRKRAA